MKSLFNFVLVFSFISNIAAQPSGWAVDNVFHVSFKYMQAGIEEESSHWQPGNLAFWTDNTYGTSSTMNAQEFRLISPTQSMDLDIGTLLFQSKNASPLYEDRARLDYNGLELINGNSWRALNVGLAGNSGQLKLYTGANGYTMASLGSTALNSGKGALRINNGAGNLRWYSAATTNYGYSVAYGINGNWNSYVGTSASNSNNGYISVHDAAGSQQAGMYVNAAGQGVIFADIKNFRIDNPLDEESEIWYASLEGPEAGAYDRGTATLVNGEAFITYSDHFRVVANSSTMTVSITPLEWDTYGLAVIEKNADGFRVKELKGGKGNFSFDWEVKCTLAGKEDYEVVRKKSSFLHAQEQIETTQIPEKKIQGVDKEIVPLHSHDEGEACPVHVKQRKK